MPIYEYSCGKCGKISDVLQRVDDPPPEACTHCGFTGQMTKVLSRSSFVLKGGGWYSEGYSSKKSSGSSEAKTGTSDSKASSSSAPAPAASTPGGSDKK